MLKEHQAQKVKYKLPRTVCKCGERISCHLKCAGCGIMLHNLKDDCDAISKYIEYRDRKLCRTCVDRWKALERQKKRILTLTQMQISEWGLVEGSER